MWLDPEETLVRFELYGSGSIEFGYARRGTGQTVGTAPLMAKVEIPIQSWGKKVPNGWFVVRSKRSLVNALKCFKESEANFLPDWLRADLFEFYFYKTNNP
jgi:hypothetical protein